MLLRAVFKGAALWEVVWIRRPLILLAFLDDHRHALDLVDLHVAVHEPDSWRMKPNVTCMQTGFGHN